MKYRIVSDSSCDILTLPGVDFVSVPLHIVTAEKDYADDAALDGSPFTAAADVSTLVVGKTVFTARYDPYTLNFLTAKPNNVRFHAAAVTTATLTFEVARYSASGQYIESNVFPFKLTGGLEGANITLGNGSFTGCESGDIFRVFLITSTFQPLCQSSAVIATAS